LLQLQHLLPQLVALAREHLRIDEDAVPLHREQHARHRHLDLRI